MFFEIVINNVYFILKGYMVVFIIVIGVVQFQFFFVLLIIFYSFSFGFQILIILWIVCIIEGLLGIGRQLYVQFNEIGSILLSLMLGLLLSILGYLFLEILVFFLFFLDFENVFVNNEWKLGNVFICLYFLKYYVKYLKDKCYKCMKKFYLMD